MKLCLSCDQKFEDSIEVCPSDGSRLVPKTEDKLVGTLVQSRYRIRSLAGKGSMGMVYRATQEFIDREVAFKVLLDHLGSDTEALKRFQREAKAASRLSHPHITTVYDFGLMPDGKPYLVMDFLSGISLSQYLEQKQYLTLDEAYPIVKDICDALSEAHKQGIIHRDVKPENIVLIEKEGRKNFVKVVDFGIAKFNQDQGDRASRLTRTGSICGSPAYMSPEQCSGKELDACSDIYALGVVLFEMFTGCLPYMSNDLLQLLYLKATEPPPLINTLRPELHMPQAMEALISRCLSKEPQERPQTMEQLWQEFDAASRSKEPAVIGGAAAPQPRPIVPAPLPEFRPASRSGTETLTLPAQGRSAPDMPVAFRPANTQSAGILPVLLPVGLGICIMLLFLFMFAGRPDAHLLIQHGQYMSALQVLKDKEKKGTLAGTDFEDLNAVYMVLANRYAQSGKYNYAIALLQQVSSKSRQAPRARQLIRRYRKLAH